MAGATATVTGRTLRYDGAMEAGRDVAVPVEQAVNIVYGTLPYAVMMATPADLEDFATGFSLTEGIVRSAAEIRAVRQEESGDGLVLAVDLAPEALKRHLSRRRSLSGRTSCGLCGIESLDQVPGAERPVNGALPGARAMERALAALNESQPLHALTHATHAAAWCDGEGRLVVLREDVGRHNALDKAIGACLRAALDPAGGFFVITSRCSFEMVEKAAVFGAPALVAISAPTSLAIARAKALGLALAAVAREDSALVFADADPAGGREAGPA